MKYSGWIFEKAGWFHSQLVLVLTKAKILYGPSDLIYQGTSWRPLGHEKDFLRINIRIQLQVLYFFFPFNLPWNHLLQITNSRKATRISDCVLLNMCLPFFSWAMGKSTWCMSDAAKGRSDTGCERRCREGKRLSEEHSAIHS